MTKHKRSIYKNKFNSILIISRTHEFKTNNNHNNNKNYDKQIATNEITHTLTHTHTLSPPLTHRQYKLEKKEEEGMFHCYKKDAFAYPLSLSWFFFI